MRLAHLLHVLGIGLAFLGRREPDEPASCAWHRLLGIGRRSVWRCLHAAEKSLRVEVSTTHPSAYLYSTHD